MENLESTASVSKILSNIWTYWTKWAAKKPTHEYKKKSKLFDW